MIGMMPFQVGKKYIAIVDGDITETFSRALHDPGAVQSLEVLTQQDASAPPAVQAKRMKTECTRSTLRGNITAPMHGRYDERPKQVHYFLYSLHVEIKSSIMMS